MRVVGSLLIPSSIESVTGTHRLPVLAFNAFALTSVVDATFRLGLYLRRGYRYF